MLPDIFIGLIQRQPLAQGSPTCRFVTTTTSGHPYLLPRHSPIAAGLIKLDLDREDLQISCRWTWIAQQKPAALVQWLSHLKLPEGVLSGTAIAEGQLHSLGSLVAENHCGWRPLLVQWMTRKSKCLVMLVALHNSCWACLFWTLDYWPVSSTQLAGASLHTPDLQIYYLTESWRLINYPQMFGASPRWFTGM